MILHNAEALRTQIVALGQKPVGFRMLRLPNDLLPLRMYHEVDWLYSTNVINDIIQENYSGIADLSLINGVRLFMQTSPFANLSSQNKIVINTSLLEIETMAKLAFLMGFKEGRSLNDFTIVTTMNHNQDPQLENARRLVQNYMSHHARLLLSVKNDARYTGLYELYNTAMGTDFPIVFDIHAAWIKSKGWYPSKIDASLVFLQSWKQRQYASLVYVGQPDMTKWPSTMSNPHVLPNYPILNLTHQFTDSTLMKHSGPQWNQKLNYLFCELLEVSDVYVDSPWANLAQEQLYDFAVLNDFI